jgi:hypothetical protein
MNINEVKQTQLKASLILKKLDEFENNVQIRKLH